MSLLLALLASSSSLVLSLKCDSFAHSGLPCTEVWRCNSGENKEIITVNQLSNGLGKSLSHSEITLCFDDYSDPNEAYLYLMNTAYDQKYLTPTSYNNCNDPIYYSNVAEFFVAPNMQADPQCYNELDISPSNVMFDAGIYNPNLNGTGFSGTDFDCATSGIKNEVTINSESWEASMAFPFSLLNCPYNCPLKMYCGHSTPNNLYRANFYRINELQDVEKCSSSTCEYMAWSPTLINPPNFHIPTQFGYLVLQL